MGGSASASVARPHAWKPSVSQTEKTLTLSLGEAAVSVEIDVATATQEKRVVKGDVPIHFVGSELTVEADPKETVERPLQGAVSFSAQIGSLQENETLPSTSVRGESSKCIHNMSTQLSTRALGMEEEILEETLTFVLHGDVSLAVSSCRVELKEEKELHVDGQITLSGILKLSRPNIS
uniref:Uncharacterized protein n=1 Tax=Chromera velia CCMP2878 TaxID=1169474 RepID=A0A0G4ICZ3_9ALVE|mmetsp:Transcript_10048/g.19434  ORF Transcript_10048/g.19434 Transcript_10048/m.19434 type:complete len:179 (-) Transcript_10048:338-874(-)|eukprot:Cvel_13175.t1-p1 / transcript=Cvel_13175.t1 / gene=Cvel_13175 / organism=Chromera_velia_CCMP2878 / gene_product=hypothetical protein / transcript_product=hypothetical protein / location=Cvel_scaffold890:2934-3467(+) / protein_length=178 / sequence_SO=supercontig / SO=protein_coding / is_pseudo=false